MTHFVTNPIIESVTAIKEPSISHFNDEDSLENEDDVDDRADEIVTFACSVCVVDFPDKNSLVKHVTEIHKGLKIKEPVSSHFKDDDILESEDDIDDPVDKKVTFACSFCVIDFPDKFSLEKHVRVIHKRLKIKEPFTSHFKDDDILENEDDIDDSGGEKITFACSFCVMDFPDRNSLVKHVNVIHKGLKVKEPSTSHSKDEDNHENEDDIDDRVGDKVTFACSVCVVDFPDKNSLVKHVTEIHKGLKIKEPVSSHFKDDDILESEDDIDDPVDKKVTFACSFCVIDFPDKFSLEKHVRVIHKRLKIKEPFTSHFKDDDILENEDDIDDSGGEKITFACSFCVMDFPDRNSLVKHVNVIHKGLKVKEPSTSHSKDEDNHENEDDIDDRVGDKVTFACSDCVIDFPDKKSLEKHVRVIHKGLKIHTCEFCQKEFFYKSHFDIHVRFHTGEKPYSCKICYKKCTTSFDLKAHVLSHNKDRRFECYVCELRFNNKNTLKKHFRTHTGEKPFVCPICDKEFSQSNSLKYHVSTHQTEDFVCNICDKTFSEKYRYDYHLRTHDPNYNNGL